MPGLFLFKVTIIIVPEPLGTPHKTAGLFAVLQLFSKPADYPGRGLIQLSRRQGFDVYTSGASVALVSVGGVSGGPKNAREVS